MKRILLTLMLIFAQLSMGVAGTVTLDPTFNGAGFQLQEFSSSGAFSSSIAVQSDGKIVVGGTMLVGNNIGDYASMRLLTMGILDTTFDVDGRVVTDLGPFDSSSSMLIQPDGKIVLGGERYSGFTNADFAVTRYHPNGTLDNSFDLNGIVATNRSGFSDEHSYGMALQTDGKLVLAGTTAADGETQTDLMMVRYNPDGSLDSSFGGSGILVIAFQNVSESANAVAIQPDGKIIIAGYLFNGFKNDFLMMRLMPNGSLDTSFGKSGLVISSINGSNNAIRTMAVKPDGKILVGGSITSGAALVQYNSNGMIDNSFGSSGIVTVTQAISKLILTTAGKILIAGSLNSRIAVARFAEDGSRDLTFNNGQNVNPPIPNNQCSSSSIVLQNDGKILIGGTCYGSLINKMIVARLVETTTKAPFDLDGDGKTDVSIFRPGPGQWWYSRSSNEQVSSLTFGTSTDTIAPADFTGDGKSDIAFFRPSTGFWFVLRSEDNSFFATPFGANGDVPVPTDFDADGKADIAVFRPSNSTWYINNSGGSPTRIQQFGIAGDVPVAADYDGDAKADIAIYRPNAVGGGQWWIQRSATSVVAALQFGTSTDKTVVGDYTGDGKADIAFWRPSTGFWNILRSEDLSYFALPFGTTGDVPVPGDYDGDGKFDAGVFRPSNSTWFVQRSTAGTLIQQFGITGDLPLPNAYVR